MNSNATPGARARLSAVFEKIYVINLPARTDRKRQMRQQLQRVGLDFDDPLVMLFEAERPESRGKWSSIGARGCFASHLNVLRHACAHGHRAILILEDDADWSDGFVRDAAAALGELDDTDWHFLHGGLDAGRGRPVFQSLPAERDVLLAHCVGLRGPSIPKLKAYLEAMAKREEGDPRGGPMHVDGAYNWFRRDSPETRAVIAAPCLAKQRSSRTDIQELSWSDRAPCIRSVKNLLRPVIYRARRALGPK